MIPDARGKLRKTATRQHTWQILEDLNDLILDNPDLFHVCDAALKYLLETAGMPSGALVVQRPDESKPFLIAGYRLPESWAQQISDPNSPLNCLIRSVLSSSRLVRAGDAIAPTVPGLAAAVPIFSRSGLQGVFLASSTSASATQIKTLEWMTRPIGRAIHWHRSNEDSRPHAKQLAALQTIIATLSFTAEIQPLQTQLVQGVCQIMKVETGALVLVDEERDGLITKKTLDQDATWIYQVNRDSGAGLIKECLRTGQSICVNDVASEPRYNASFDALEGLEVRSILCAPLVVQGETLGAIQVFNKLDGTFDDYDIDLLSLVASLASHTLYVTRLIQQLKVANADLEASHWELLRSRNTLRALFDSMPAALYIIDRKHKLVAVNLSCSQRTGKQPNVLVGRQCYEALYARKEPCAGCLVSETFYTGQNTNRTERRWGKEEDPTEWEISTYPILDEMDQAVQAILLEQDVTERRRLEGILAQSEKLAAVGQLAAGVAHEINNPLTAIIANAQLLQRQLPPDDEMQESVDLIARAGARATQVVRNLLDFARKEQYNLAATDVNETIQRALTLIQHELLARSITLSFEPARDLPRLLASHDHLQGVWLNLLLNAVDAIDTQPGKIRVTTRRVGNEIRTSIADNGKGIPPERISRIFEPFYTTKAPGRGTGLGLSVCHRIVKQHGGHILVDSQLGMGTEFTVVLPIT